MKFTWSISDDIIFDDRYKSQGIIDEISAFRKDSNSTFIMDAKGKKLSLRAQICSGSSDILQWPATTYTDGVTLLNVINGELYLTIGSSGGAYGTSMSIGNVNSTKDEMININIYDKFIIAQQAAYPGVLEKIDISRVRFNLYDNSVFILSPHDSTVLNFNYGVNFRVEGNAVFKTSSSSAVPALIFFSSGSFFELNDSSFFEIHSDYFIKFSKSTSRAPRFILRDNSSIEFYTNGNILFESLDMDLCDKSRAKFNCTWSEGGETILASNSLINVRDRAQLTMDSDTVHQHQFTPFVVNLQEGIPVVMFQSKKESADPFDILNPDANYPGIVNFLSQGAGAVIIDVPDGMANESGLSCLISKELFTLDGNNFSVMTMCEVVFGSAVRPWGKVGTISIIYHGQAHQGGVNSEPAFRSGNGPVMR